ncbi:DinB family protein [Paenibacillus sp. GCM10027629]|uniref:DinB family protein n=1 Tax=Paenibacillus sp. GCM10027629 TaxID=3273414 RepID=UPI00362619B3
MLIQPLDGEHATYYDRYIGLVPEGDIRGILEQQLERTTEILASLSEEQGDFRYAPDKWSIKEVIGHIADTERVMSYRLLRIARGDQTPLTGFDENAFVNGAAFASTPMSELIEDLRAVRRATNTLLRGVTDEAAARVGTANHSPISVRALAYIIAGHEIHHLNILKERYHI